MTAKRSLSDVLAVGFGTTVAMWATAYVCRLPSVSASSRALLFLLLLCLGAGGFVAGRYSHRRCKGAVAACLLASLLNLMILGSLLTGTQPNQLVPSAFWWVPGSLLVSAVIGWLGGAIGSAIPRQSPEEVNWLGVWTKVLTAATLLLLIIGGLVTGYQAGLSVVDWPNSFGYNMFLYPLSRMTGDVYYEHAHRLFGSLVGLTMLSLAIYLRLNDRRAWLHQFAWAALLAVIVQGILGGLRVTGRFTFSTQAADTAPNIALAIVHGTFGQVFFAMTVALAVFTSTAWRRGVGENAEGQVLSAEGHANRARLGASPLLPGATDRTLSTILVALLIIQLVLGAILRHVSGGLLIHIAIAVVVVFAAMNSALRAWGLYHQQPTLRRIGRTLALLTGVQVIMGLTAYIVLGITTGIEPRPGVQALLTTIHQVTGALVLVCAVMLMLWNYRLLAQAVEGRAKRAPGDVHRGLDYGQSMGNRVDRPGERLVS
ncbi:MAG TPA: hypothetical protein VMV94_19200 [Phycisphaerae bacterium]|nr:hypothetical protein [Phycisphaerae bacterium]